MFESMLQQICPAGQQNVPQQVSPRVVHAASPPVTMHAGGAAQVPLSQKGVDPEQTCPQSPQFCGSL
jgi:hypothetical protein